MIRLTDAGARFATGRLADSMEVALRVLTPLSPPSEIPLWIFFAEYSTATTTSPKGEESPVF